MNSSKGLSKDYMMNGIHELKIIWSITVIFHIFFVLQTNTLISFIYMVYSINFEVSYMRYLIFVLVLSVKICIQGNIWMCLLLLWLLVSLQHYNKSLGKAPRKIPGQNKNTDTNIVTHIPL